MCVSLAAVTVTTTLPFQVLFKPCSLVVMAFIHSLKSYDFVSFPFKPVSSKIYSFLVVSMSPNDKVLNISEDAFVNPLGDKLTLT